MRPAQPDQARSSKWAVLAAIVLSGLAGGCLSTAGKRPYREVQSYASLKYAVTVRQAYDFSCGGAAIATLLTHHLGRPTTEVEVLDKLRSRYPGKSWEALQKSGFSLEDLIWVSNQLGFEAQAARVSANDLSDLNGPVIVHVNKGTFEHFTVLRARKFGRIVNITSAMVKSPAPEMGLSTAARAALSALSKSISKGVAADNVTLNNLLPFRIDTARQQFFAKRMADKDGISVDEARQRIAQTVAAKRMGSPEEFGEACAFLCSKQASFISGQNLQLDGGSYAGLI